MPLRDPELKVEWAKKHLDALNAAHVAFTNSEPYTISAEDDLERGHYVLTVKTNSPPFSLALIAGDFISCLRSSLDHLAWQLASDAAKRSTRLCFPIHGENSLDVQMSITKQTYGIPEAAISIIKSLQPYNSGNAYKTSLLWLLNALWNIDKHRHITLHSGIYEFLLSATYDRRVFGEPEATNVDDGCVLRFPVAAKPHMDLKPRCLIQVTFGDEQEGVEVLIGWFSEVYEFVSTSVIPQFAGFFA